MIEQLEADLDRARIGLRLLAGREGFHIDPAKASLWRRGQDDTKWPKFRNH
jgi:hypothetical protein